MKMIANEYEWSECGEWSELSERVSRRSGVSEVRE